MYEKRLAEGFDHIALIGDLNDTPDSAPLAPLKESTLKDAFTHPAFDDGGFPGTFGLGNAGNKIDYLFLSPKHFLTRSSEAVSSARAPGPEAGRNAGRPIRNSPSRNTRRRIMPPSGLTCTSEAKDREAAVRRCHGTHEEGRWPGYSNVARNLRSRASSWAFSSALKPCVKRC
ncbi:endonuclease/exonuclease/phosphatase family protein [Rhizobium sp. IBUN]|uniref:endonuclease/exonuclease/phosphatase family protein n=1 Tax=Rhizobium sp. IBUN TaxID=1042326 RepID=UPI0032AF3556